MRPLGRRAVAAGRIAVVGAALAACGQPTTTPGARADLSQGEALRRVSPALNFHCGPNPFTLRERLPNITYVPSSGPEFSFSDVVVRGDVTAVEKGAGFYTPPHDAPSDTRTDFDDRRSTWKTVHLTVRVVEVLAGEAPAEISVGFKIEPDTSVEEARALVAVDDAVFLLSRDHVFFDYDPGLLGSNPDTIVTVAPDGHLAIPALDGTDEQRTLGDTPDVPSLAAAAAQPARRVERDMPGCA